MRRERDYLDNLCYIILIVITCLSWSLFCQVMAQDTEIKKLRKREQELLNKIDQFAEIRY